MHEPRIRRPPDRPPYPHETVFLLTRKQSLSTRPPPTLPTGIRLYPNDILCPPKSPFSKTFPPTLEPIGIGPPDPEEYESRVG